MFSIMIKRNHHLMKSQFHHLLICNAQQVNWAAVAEDMGLKNATVASVRFGQIKKKFFGDNGKAAANGGSDGSPTKVVKRGRPAGDKKKSPRKQKDKCNVLPRKFKN